jgi:hypothetical protein
MTGMFLRENRIDVAGNEQPKQKKSAAKKSKEEDENLPASYKDESMASETEDKGLF